MYTDIRVIWTIYIKIIIYAYAKNIRDIIRCMMTLWQTANI